MEIIIVNDGSTDGTLEILEEYKIKYRDKIFPIFQKNQGPGAARNRGIQVSKGKFIVFLDSDDYLLSESLLQRLAFFEKHPQVDIVFGDYYLQKKSERENVCFLEANSFLHVFRDAILFKNEGMIIFNKLFYEKYFLFSPLPIWTGTVMLKKNVVEQTGLFRTDIKVAEDVDYWLRVIRKFNAGYIDRPLAVYRRQEDTITRNVERYIFDNIKFYDGLYKGREDKKSKSIIRMRLSLAFFDMGYYYLGLGQPKRAVSFLLKSIFYNPFSIKVHRTLLKAILLFSIRNHWKDEPR